MTPSIPKKNFTLKHEYMVYGTFQNLLISAMQFNVDISQTQHYCKNQKDKFNIM